MEFASRRPRLPIRVLGVAAVGLLAIASLTGTACRSHRPDGASFSSDGRSGAAPAAPPLFVLEGVVRDAAGQGVPGARVFIVLRVDGDEGAGQAAHASSAADGRFTLADLPAGRYTLIVDALGLGSVEPRPVDVPGPVVDVRLPNEVRWLGGTVVAAGLPVADARVLLGGAGARAPRETTSTEEGAFRFAVLEAGAYALRATRGPLASPTSRGLAAGARAVTLALGAGVIVTGQVVDDEGRGQGGVEARAETGADDPAPESTRTAADGSFRLGPLPPERVRVAARATGYVLRAPVSLALVAAIAPPPARLVLVRGASLSGRVVDARGAAVAGADLRCLVAGADATVDDLAVLDGALLPAAEAAALGAVVGRALGASRTARTDARGVFHFADLLPGATRLEITRAPFVPLEADAVTLAPGAARDLGALVLRDGATVSGHVRDATGTPLGGARITVTPPVGVYAETDGAGAFAFALAPGRYTLVASAPGVGERGADVEVASGTPTPPVELVLAAADGVVAGVARDDGRRPLARARVRAFALATPPADDAAPAPPAPGALALGTTRTDAGGHFTLGHLPRQPVLLELDAVDYPVTYAVATPGAAVELTAPIPGGVDGEVRERATGAVVPRARVDALGPDGQRATAGARGAKGAGLTFRFTRLRPGHWTLTASAPGYGAATRELDVPASPILGETSVRALRLELERSR